MKQKENIIEIDIASHGKGKVRMNGVELDCVKSISIKAGVDSMNEVTLVVYADKIRGSVIADNLNLTSYDDEINSASQR